MFLVASVWNVSYNQIIYCEGLKRDEACIVNWEFKALWCLENNFLETVLWLFISLLAVVICEDFTAVFIHRQAAAAKTDCILAHKAAVYSCNSMRVCVVCVGDKRRAQQSDGTAC